MKKFDKKLMEYMFKADKQAYRFCVKSYNKMYENSLNNKPYNIWLEITENMKRMLKYINSLESTALERKNRDIQAKQQLNLFQ